MEPLEDHFEDILKKAIWGQERSPADLASRHDLSRSAIKALLEGRVDEAHLALLAPTLHLKTAPLLSIATCPNISAPALPKNLRRYSSAFGDMTVNAYLLEVPEADQALLFDTGTDASAIIKALETSGLPLTWIILTHAHPDHIEALPEIRAKFPNARIMAPLTEKAGLGKFAGEVNAPDKLNFGSTSLTPVSTPGHSPGGTSYLIQSTGVPDLLICGDALFARSIGGIRQSAPGETLKQTYHKNLENLKSLLESLSGETILCPGHGPATTAQTEQIENPFF